MKTNINNKNLTTLTFNNNLNIQNWELKGLNPFFITGFVDAEGSFMIIVKKSKTNKIGWNVEAMFEICLHSKDLQILNEIQAFFGIGKIYIKSNRKEVSYRVRDIKSISNVIIPYFNKYPLHSAKSIDFQLFKECVELVNAKKHLTESGLEKIISIKSAINWGISGLLKDSFPNVIPIKRPSYIISEEPLNPYWISGFFEGESSFIVSIRSSNQIQSLFSILLNERELPLLIKIQAFFKVGNINKNTTNNAVQYSVSAITDLNIIINHFEHYSLLGAKLSNYLIWKEVVSLIVKKSHLTQEGRIKIISLKDKLNK
jgi:hypothetical protein